MRWIIWPVIMLAVLPTTSRAIAPFKREFEAKYVKQKPKTSAEQQFAQAVKQAGCNVCHTGPDKRGKNSYGRALDELLNKTDGAEREKIRGAFDVIAEEPAEPNSRNQETFGERIKRGVLPGG